MHLTREQVLVVCMHTSFTTRDTACATVRLYTKKVVQESSSLHIYSFDLIPTACFGCLKAFGIYSCTIVHYCTSRSVTNLSEVGLGFFRTRLKMGGCARWATWEETFETTVVQRILFFFVSDCTTPFTKSQRLNQRLNRQYRGLGIKRYRVLERVEHENEKQLCQVCTIIY